MSLSPPAGTTAAPSRAEEPVDRRKILPAGLAAIAAAVAGNLVVWALGRALFDISDDFEPLATPWPAVIASVVYLALATAVFWGVSRFAARPVRSYRIVAVIALVLSFLPLTSLGSAAGVSAGAIATLVAMHLVGFAAAVGVLTTRTRPSAVR
jgi:hypothetical protein